MCFDADSLPPIPVLSGAAVSHDDLVLTSADGTEFAAFSARPDGPAKAGVVVLPDVRGLYRFYEELALRFAERGIRPSRSTTSAGRPASRSATTTSSTCRTSPRRTRSGVQADVAAAVAHLRGLGCGASSRSASASAAATRGSRRRPATACAAPSASTAYPTARNGVPGAARAGGRDRGSDSRPAGRRRPEHHEGRERRLRSRPDRRASTTRSSSTTAPPTASSTASTKSSQPPPKTPGTAPSPSSSAWPSFPAGRLFGQGRCQAP